MSFALGLAILAGGLSLGLRNYLTAAARQERSLRDLILLESAVAAELGEISAGGDLELSGATRSGATAVSVVLSLPAAKIDLAEDPDESIAHGAEALGLALDPAVARRASGLADLSRRLRLSAADEDCLRAVFTYGRGGAPRIEAADLPLATTLRAGDQVDVRAAIAQGPVLWVRARFTGRETGWALHDHRRLSQSCSAS